MRKIMKCAVLLALIMMASVTLIALPAEGTPIAKWCALLFVSKAVCACFTYVAWRLYNRWNGTLGMLDKILKGED